MEHAKKYALVPQEMISKHIIPSKQLSQLDRDMIQILNSALGDDEKLKLYYDLLQKKMNFEKFNPSIQKTTNSPVSQDTANQEIKEEVSPVKEENDSLILNTVPQNMRKYATNLLAVLKTRPDKIKWNDRREISYHGELFQNSNIIDLFHWLFTNKKEPISSHEEFISVLRDLNIPQCYFRNKHISCRLDSKNEMNVSKSRLSKSKNKSVKWLPF